MFAHACSTIIKVAYVSTQVIIYLCTKIVQPLSRDWVTASSTDFLLPLKQRRYIVFHYVGRPLHSHHSRTFPRAYFLLFDYLSLFLSRLIFSITSTHTFSSIWSNLAVLTSYVCPRHTLLEYDSISWKFASVGRYHAWKSLTRSYH